MIVSIQDKVFSPAGIFLEQDEEDVKIITAGGNITWLRNTTVLEVMCIINRQLITPLI